MIDLCQHLTTCDFSFRGCHASLCREPWDALDSPYLHDPGPQKRGVKHQLQSLWRCRPTMFSSCFLASPMQDHHMRLSEPSQTHPPPIHCFPTGNTRLKTLIHALFPFRLNASKTELIMGQPYTLGCHVGEPVEIKSCSWQFRSGPRIPFNPSEQPSEGTISQNSKSCNLTLNVLTIEHMGTWSCR